MSESQVAIQRFVFLYASVRKRNLGNWVSGLLTHFNEPAAAMEWSSGKELGFARGLYHVHRAACAPVSLEQQHIRT